MSPTPGSKLGVYEILEPIGAGGMGEVYRAKDTRLKREVALKVLPAAFAEDPARMARFQREAEVLASLNHPNIATIYGVEEQALAMELVEGETLHGPVPIELAVGYARQIAEALEYAHDRGVIHRDLKPANVKVSPDGIVKLLDFGLAKAVEDPGTVFEDLSNSPTLTLSATRTGVILGTAAYMSPEQAHGKAVDRRSDIFSFGSLLYEMLTGKPAFTGESVGDTLASVLKLDPDWNALPRETPTAIRNLLRRCLTKDRKQRLQAIGEARIVLANPIDEHPSLAAAGRARVLPWAIAALMSIVAIAALWGWFRSSPAAPRRVVRFTDVAPIATTGNELIAVSRDGSRIAYVGGPQRQIYVRTLDRLDARPIPGTDDAVALAFSPDGGWISYVSGRRTSGSEIKKIAIDGGSPYTIAPASTRGGPPSQDWAKNDTIFFSADGVLQQVASSGGKPEILASPDPRKSESYYSSPQLLPGGRWLLYTITVPGGYEIAVFNLEMRESKILLRNAGAAKYVPTGPDPAIGHLVYYDSGPGTLMGAGFDVNRLQLKGAPVPVLEGIQAQFVSGLFAFSETGVLAYVPGSGNAAGRSLVWVDRQGMEQSIPAPSRQYNSLELSPDGQRVATMITSDGRQDVWVVDAVRGALTRIPSENSTNVSPVWTPDGSHVIFTSGSTANSGVLVSAPADGSGPPSVLANLGMPGFPQAVFPNGKFLLGTSRSNANANVADVWVLPFADSAGGDAKVRTMLQARPSAGAVRISPDGHLLAYQCENEVCIQSYPGPGGKQTVSSNGGSTPRWGGNGELFYRNRDKMVAVQVQTTPAVRLGESRIVFEKNNYALVYDVTPDGKRFLMLKVGAAREAAAEQLNIIVNWFDELRRRVP